MAIGETFSHIEISFFAFTGTEGVDRTTIYRELEFDGTHDCASVDNIVRSMERANWGIQNVTIYTDNDSLETGDITDAGTLSVVFDALYYFPGDAGKIIAYGELFGWNESHFENTRYARAFEDGYYGVYDTAEEFAQEFVENDEEMSSLLTHPYVYVDWERTTRNLMNDFASHEYGYELYVFANH
jgi:hypothetical protein